MSDSRVDSSSVLGSDARSESLTGWQTPLILMGITVAALLLRLAFIWRAGFDGEALVRPDSSSYLGSAEALLRDGRFSVAPSSEESMWLRTPGYPLFLTGFMAVVGTSPLWLGVVQSVVLLVLIPLVYWLGAMLVSRTVGLVAAGACALDPLVSYHSAVLLTEGLASVLLTALAIALVKAVRSPAGFPRWWLAVGLLLVGSTMVRPTTYYLGAIIVFSATAWVGWRSRKLLTTAATFAMVVIPQAMVIGSWRVRNSNLFGSSRFSSIEAASMLFYRGAGVVARRDGVTLDQAQVQLGEELGRPSDFATQGEYIETMYSKGLEIVLAHPVDYLAVALRGLVSALFGPGREPLNLLFGDTLGLPVAMGNLLVICLSWVLIFVFLWSVRSSPSNRGAVLWVASVPLYLLVVSAGPEAYGRFRTPVIPILLVFAVAGGVQVWNWSCARSARRLSVGLSHD